MAIAHLVGTHREGPELTKGNSNYKVVLHWLFGLTEDQACVWFRQPYPP